MLELDGASCDRLFDKLRAFVGELDRDERLAFAALIGPGVAMAHSEDTVEGFEQTWMPSQLPDALARAVRESGLDLVKRDTP